MPKFQYHALNASGQPVAGEITADDAHSAVARLIENGLTVQSIAVVASESPRSTVKPPARLSGESLERSVLRSHMTMILSRGQAIVPALRAYAEEMPFGWQRRQLVSVCNVLEKNNADEATAALSAMPESWIPLLSAAASSNDPSQVLRDYLIESQRSDRLRQKWWLALTYPLILVALVTMVMTVLSVVVLPEFAIIFREFGLSLPWLTLSVLNLSGILAVWGIPLVVCLAAIVAIFFLNANHLLPPTLTGWINERLRPPFARRTNVARFTQFTADLLDAGVSVPDSLRIAGFAVNYPSMQRAAWRLANELESNGQFSQSEFARPLTASVAYALSPRVPASSRVRVLREISNCHGERVLLGLSWASGIVEPLAICAVGIAVGITVIALFLPLVKLVDGLA